MKPIVPAALVGLAVAAAAAGAVASPGASAAAASSAAPPCIPKLTTIKGHEQVSYCGPATATLTIAGKTYSFKNGQCSSIKVSGIVVDITLGTVADGTGEKLNSKYFADYISKKYGEIYEL